MSSTWYSRFGFQHLENCCQLEIKLNKFARLNTKHPFSGFDTDCTDTLTAPRVPECPCNVYPGTRVPPCTATNVLRVPGYLGTRCTRYPITWVSIFHHHFDRAGVEQHFEGFVAQPKMTTGTPGTATRLAHVQVN
eukprot:2137139-Rhodomonas_salina.1